MAGGVSPGRSARPLPGPESTHRLQCGRGSIPRKVGRSSPSPPLPSPGFNVAGGVSPGRSPSALPGRGGAGRGASMWPGEYPPEGRAACETAMEERHLASMWPGEYPPEGPAGGLAGSSPLPRFNVAGGVSPGRSPDAPSAWTPGISLQCGRGSIPRKVVAEWWREEQGIPAASMWPGEYPPEGPRLRRPAAGWPPPASMWPGEYPPEGRRPHLHIRPAQERFNVAGGVSPGRSSRPHASRSSTVPASMWPGEYPPEGRHDSTTTGRDGNPASMWPGEYPPEGPVRSSGSPPPRSRFNVAGGVSPGRSRGDRAMPIPPPGALQCGRGSIPRKVVITSPPTPSPGRRFNVAGGVSPGRSPEQPTSTSSTATCFNVAGGVSPGRSG